MQKAFSFSDLAEAELVVDALYAGGTAKNVSDDPIAKLLPVGNSGGIRYKGDRRQPRIIALITSGTDLDWPDSFDPETGLLTYFGDNKTGGREIHDTPRGGNVVLRNVFDAAHSIGLRRHVAPAFVFTRAGSGRTYRFIGLAVPGSGVSTFADDLIGIWRSTLGLRYQNYRATFTVLDVPTVSREWIRDILHGEPISTNAPKAWLDWISGSTPRALLAPRTAAHRSKSEQEPSDAIGRKLLMELHAHFSSNPHEFEHFAAYIVRLSLPAVVALDVTRKSRDGGRDAIGQYRVGNGGGQILLDFSMEAKCYAPGNSVGVAGLSRLISRLRHRQFGVLVTTSHLDLQAYKELKEDDHPIVVIAGNDIVNAVKVAGLPSGADWIPWLKSNYPI